MQKGRIEQRGNCWLLRYREPVLNEATGKVEMKPTSKKLGSYPQIRNEKQAQVLADAILAPINARTNPAESASTLKTFTRDVFLIEETATLKPSTKRTYRQLWSLVDPYVNGDEMRSMTCMDIERILQKVAGVDREGKLLPGRELIAHTTIRKVKRFLSVVFRAARRRNLTINDPVRDAKLPRGKKSDTHAYTLEEVTNMLRVLPESTAKLALMTLALTALRPCELKGMKWGDYDGEQLNVQRAVWNGIEGEVKTLDSKAPVPVIEPLRRALDAHRAQVPNNPTDYIFAGERCGRPLRIENDLRRHMLPIFKERGIEWYGWYALRRGCATILHQLGVPDKEIQAILRHSDVKTTQSFYIKTVSVESKAAMQKLAAAFNAQVSSTAIQ